MFEAVRTDLVSTIGLKRSTQNLQLSTSSPADYPIFEEEPGRRSVAHHPHPRRGKADRRHHPSCSMVCWTQDHYARHPAHQPSRGAFIGRSFAPR
jgi:hypothetical protein